jgi:uncharacterized protein
MILVWNHVHDNFKGDCDGIHGPSHWKSVEQTAVTIAAQNGGDVEIASAFAALHDFCRLNDGNDEGHGRRAALYATKIRRKVLANFSPERFAKLYYALYFHAHGMTSDNPTIGACWDADRLDLKRAGVGITPDPAMMSTEFGRRTAMELQLRSFITES